MLKDIESKDTIESSIAKRQLMCVADDIGVLEDLVLEFDARWVFFGSRTGPDVKDKALAFAQDFFEIRAHCIGYVVRRNGDDMIIDEDRHFILDSVADAAPFALQLLAPRMQVAAAGGTTDNTGNALIHSTEPMVRTTG